MLNMRRREDMTLQHGSDPNDLSVYKTVTSLYLYSDVTSNRIYW